jgi:hypothetical protein
VSIDQFLSDHKLLFGILQPILFCESVIEKVRHVIAPFPRFVVDLIEPYIEGRTLTEQTRVAAGIFLAFQSPGGDLCLLQLPLLFGQQPGGTLGWVQLCQFFLLFLLSSFFFCGGGSFIGRIICRRSWVAVFPYGGKLILS